MKYFFTLIFILYSFLSFTQGESKNQYLKIAKSNQTIPELNLLLVEYKDSLRISTESNNINKIAFNNLIISKLYYKLGSSNKSVGYGKVAIEKYEIIKDTTFIMYALINIGSIYGSLNEQEIALEYFNKIENHALQTNNAKALSVNYINQALIYSRTDPNKSLEYFSKAKQYISLDKENSLAMFYLLNNEAVVYFNMADYENALLKFKESQKYIVPNHMHYGSVLSNIAQTYKKTGKLDSALLYINKVLSIPKDKQNLNDLTLTYYRSTEIWIEKNNIDSVSKYLKLFKTFNDSLIINKKIEFTSKLKVVHETNKLLNNIKTQKLELSKNKVKINYLTTVIILIFIGLIIFFIIYKKLQLSYKNIVKESVHALKADEENILLKNSLLQYENNKNIKSEHKIEQSDEIYKQIIDLFNNDKLYRDKDFSILKVTEILNSNRTYISNIINSKSGLSFVKLVNQYRIKDAKKMLVDDENNKLTLDAIGKSAGFNSTSTFNRVFKAETGVTPSFFVKNISGINN